MMMNKRLINTVSQSKKYIAGNVAFQWCSMAANIAGVFAAGNLIGRLAAGKPEKEVLWGTVLVVIAVLAVRCICLLGSARMSFLSSESVKKTLRREIYQKLLRLGSSYPVSYTHLDVYKRQWLYRRSGTAGERPGRRV